MEILNRFAAASEITGEQAAARDGSVPDDTTPTAVVGDSTGEPVEQVENATIDQDEQPSRVPGKQPGAVLIEPPARDTETELPLSPPAWVRQSSPRSRSKRRRRDLVYIGLIVLLLSLLVYALLSRSTPTTTTPSLHPTPAVPASTTPGGQVYFLSSGQINESTGQGIADELQVDLQNIPDPAAGKSYYAWLLPDKDPGTPILLGKLPVKQGIAHLLYTGDANHTNLFALGSRLVVSEDTATVTPAAPALSTWRFYDAISQIPSSTDNLSLLAHLRYLLAGDPALDKLGLPGGVNIWFFRNSAKVAEWASSARDDWQDKNPTYIHRHIIRILDYTDGSALVKNDVPAGTPLYVNARDAQVPLLEISSATQQPAGYFSLVKLRLNGVLQSPNISAKQVQLITLLDAALNHAQTCMEQVRQDARQLVTRNDEQLLQPSSLALLNDMFTSAYCAFGGQFDPTNITAIGGVAAIYNVIQYLGTFDVRAYRK